MARPPCPDQGSAQCPTLQTPDSGRMRGLWSSSVLGMALQLRELPRRDAVGVRRGAVCAGEQHRPLARLQPCSSGPADSWQGLGTLGSSHLSGAAHPFPGQVSPRQLRTFWCHLSLVLRWADPAIWTAQLGRPHWSHVPRPHKQACGEGTVVPKGMSSPEEGWAPSLARVSIHRHPPPKKV